MIIRPISASYVIALAAFIPTQASDTGIPSIGALYQEIHSSPFIGLSIHEAAIAGNPKAVALNIQNHVSPDLLDEYGNSALHYAAQAGDAESLEILVLAGGDVHLKNPKGISASDLAATAECKKVIALAAGLREKELKLCDALLQGDIEALELYLANKGNPNAKGPDGVYSLLCFALSKRQLAAAKILIQAGALTDAPAPDGKNILLLASGVGDEEIIHLLLKGEKRMPMRRTESGSSPLHEAVLYRNLDTLKTLLPYFERMNFNPHFGDQEGPFNMALDRNDPEMVQLFLDAGMRVKAPTAEELAAEEAQRKASGQGAPPNGRRGMPTITPLIDAVKSGHPAMVIMMLEAGADKEATDKDGKRAADYAQGEILELIR